MANIKINQTRIVNNLNDYFQWNNLALEMNRGGICHGLATVYAKYVVEGREKEFEQILEYISGHKPQGLEPQKINLLISQVLESFLPEHFNKQLSQMRSIEALTIDNQALQSSFSFALCANDESWNSILADINLNVDDAMLVSSINHTVTVARALSNEGEAEGYVIYDPNYPEGFRAFENEAALVNELHHNVFCYDDGPLGMSIHVIQHPNAEKRLFPSASDLYQAHLIENNVTEKATITQNGQKLEGETLYIAAESMSQQDIETLLAIGKNQFNQDNFLTAALAGVRENNMSGIEALLPHIGSKEDQHVLLSYTIGRGRKEIWDKLMKNESYKKLFENLTMDKEKAPYLIYLAAKGGHPELLQKSLDACKDNIILGFFDEDDESIKQMWLAKEIVSPKYEDEQPIPMAIKNGHTQCVRILLEHANAAQEQLNKAQKASFQLTKQDYLKQAIAYNQLGAVRILSKQVGGDFFKNYRPSVDEVKNTNLFILKHMQEQGVQFSPQAQQILAEKEKRPISISLKVGILLYDIATFFKTIANKLSSKAPSLSNASVQEFKAFKEEYQKMVPDESVKYEVKSLDDFLGEDALELDLDSEDEETPPSPLPSD